MQRTREKTRSQETVRTSVSLRNVDYGQVAEIAAQKKVSIAWVIREAVETYLEAREPLFKSEVR